MRLSSPRSSDFEANRPRDSQSMTPNNGQKPRRHARKQNANLQGDSDHTASTSTRSEPTPTMETHSLVSAATMIEAAARGMIARADMRRVSEDILNAIHGMETDSMQQAIHHMKMVSSPNSRLEGARSREKIPRHAGHRRAAEWLASRRAKEARAAARRRREARDACPRCDARFCCWLCLWGRLEPPPLNNSLQLCIVDVTVACMQPSKVTARCSFKAAIYRNASPDLAHDCARITRTCILESNNGGRTDQQ